MQTHLYKGYAYTIQSIIMDEETQPKDGYLVCILTTDLREEHDHSEYPDVVAKRLIDQKISSEMKLDFTKMDKVLGVSQ